LVVILKINNPLYNLFAGREMILLIDDEKVVRMITTELLQFLGYDVHVCASGEEGIDFFQDNHDEVDLVILDMVMPGMRGNAVFQHLKEIHSDAKVLFLSGYSHDHEVEEILKSGALGYLRKPISLDELGDKVKSALIC